MVDISSRVATGIQFLDEKVSDWREKINIELLDVGSVKECPLGQIFGGYLKGLYNLDLEDDEDLVALGLEADILNNEHFLGNRKDFALKLSEEYAILTDEWKRQISGSNL